MKKYSQDICHVMAYYITLDIISHFKSPSNTFWNIISYLAYDEQFVSMHNEPVSKHGEILTKFRYQKICNSIKLFPLEWIYQLVLNISVKNWIPKRFWVLNGLRQIFLRKNCLHKNWLGIECLHKKYERPLVWYAISLIC